MILPSILIMTGEYVVKKRSDAFLSTINLNNGLTFTPYFRVSALCGSEVRFALFFREVQALALIRLGGKFALALQLDLEPELVLRVGVAHGFLVRYRAVLVELEQRLIERLHAEAVRLRHDVFDHRDLAAED